MKPNPEPPSAREPILHQLLESDVTFASEVGTYFLNEAHRVAQKDSIPTPRITGNSADLTSDESDHGFRVNRGAAIQVVTLDIETRQIGSARLLGATIDFCGQYQATPGICSQRKRLSAGEGCIDL
jgi:hypothetical protein